MNVAIEIARQMGVTLALGTIVVIAQTFVYYLLRYTKPNIRYHESDNDQTGDVTFLIRNLDSVRYQDGLRVKLEPLDAIERVGVHAGPWCPETPAADPGRECVTVRFKEVPEDATFSIKVRRTVPRRTVTLYLDEQSPLQPRHFNTPLPPMRLSYFVARFIVGLGGYLAVFLGGLFYAGERLRLADWAFLAAGLPLALAMFVLVVPHGGKSLVAGYLGWSGAAKEWPTPPEPADQPLADDGPSRPGCDVLIVVALTEEHKPFDKLLDDMTAHALPIPHWTARLRTRTGAVRTLALIVQKEMGGIEAAATTTRATALLRPNAVLMSGIMGGFRKKGVALGDVVIASESIDYAFGKLTTTHDPDGKATHSFKGDPRTKKVSDQLHGRVIQWLTLDQDENGISRALRQIRPLHLGEKLAMVSAEFGAKIHFKPVASGPLVVASNDKIEEILSINRNIIGVEMEINGMMHGAETAGVTQIIGVKAISDFADPDKDAPASNDGKMARAFATHASAAICCRLITDEVL